MKIGIISVRDKAYHPTRRLAEAAASRGHRVVVIDPYSTWPAVVGNTARLSGGAATSGLPDVVLPRQGAQVGQSCLVLISHFGRMGIPLVNDLAAIRLTRNQFLTLQALAAAGVTVPDTLFINAPDGLAAAAQYPLDYPVVVKQINGRQGAGVALARNARVLEAMITANLERTQGLLLQKFVPTAGRQDIRVLVIGGKIAGAMRLLPPAGEFRANFHLGATGQAHELTPRAAQTALDAARAVGLDVAGVDLIQAQSHRVYVIEVNYSPGFKGLEQATGLDVAGMIIDQACTRAANKPDT